MPNILCTTSLSTKEIVKVVSLARLLDKTPEDIIRMAVKKFSAVCVPTHTDKKNRTA